MSEDPNDFLMSGGAKYFGFLQIGNAIDGVITQPPEKQQQTDLKTGELKTWKDGSPMWMLRVILQTDLRDDSDPEDTGVRSIYIRSGMREAVANAVKLAGARGLEVGGRLWVKYVSDGPAQRGFAPPKIYKAKYSPPAASSERLQDMPTSSGDLSPEELEAAPF